MSSKNVQAQLASKNLRTLMENWVKAFASKKNKLFKIKLLILAFPQKGNNFLLNYS